MIARSRVVSFLAPFFLTTLMSMAAWSQTTIHGANSLFVSPSVKIAWAVLKGATDETTSVVIRVVNSVEEFRYIRLDGVDPFSKRRKPFTAVRSFVRQIDISVSRALFSEYPSCEVQLFTGNAPLDGALPNLTVYYLSVPDTTPEFTTVDAVDAYFARILANGK
jgi:hypothetical protein